MSITASQISSWNTATALTENAATASQALSFAYPDDKIVIVISNDNTATGTTATVEIPYSTGIQGTSDATDASISKKQTASFEVAKGAVKAVVLESMKFKGTDSEVDIAVSVTNSGTVSLVKIAQVVLP
jgi:catabolite regulation protein CreA